VFLEKVTQQGRQFLIAGWVCLTVALLAILITYQAATRILSAQYQNTYAEENRVRQMQIALTQHDHKQIRDLATGLSSFDPATSGKGLRWIELGAIGALVAGVIFLLVAAAQFNAA
jgi:hypothetical protein